VRQQDGEAYAGLVEPAVVIQLTDGHAEPSLAVGVFASISAYQSCTH
jgi:hypothetical protein